MMRAEVRSTQCRSDGQRYSTKSETRNDSTGGMLRGHGRLVIKSVDLVDVVAGTTQREMDIILEDERIVSIGHFGDNVAGQVVVGRGLCVVPSFIDLHTHVTFEQRAHVLPMYQSRTDDTVSLVRGAQNLLDALMHGVCLMRDAGDGTGQSMVLKGLVEEGLIVGPELVLSGRPLCVAGGHGHMYGDVLRPGIDSRELELFLTRHRDRGHEWVKVMNGPERHDPATLRTVTEHAHHCGLRVMCHAFTEDGIRDAILAGVDTIEHGLPFDSETVDAATRSGTTFVPTFYCAWTSLRPEYTSTQPSAAVRYLEQWWESLGRWFPYSVENRTHMAVGTDAGDAPSCFGDVVDEMQMMVRGGLQPIEALRAATCVPAHVLGRERDYGTVDVGKLANILLVSCDPTTQVPSNRSIVAAYFRGAQLFNYNERPWI